MRFLTPSTFAFLAMTLPVLASSDEEWARFRAQVQEACTALAPSDGETVIEVNPFGSERYGAALIIHTIDDDLADRYICIYDKQTKEAELTAPFTPPGSTSAAIAAPDGTVTPESQTTTDAELVKP